MPPLPDAEVERVLVVAAHPDDVDFGVAGTVATWTDAGIEVTYAICTDGQAGGFDRELPRSRLPEIRRAEQRKAAAAVGVADVRFLGYEDGELTASRELVRDLVRVIRQVRPQRVVTQSPDRWWDRIQASHPDHLAAGEATVRAIYPYARNPFAFPELLRDEQLEDWTVVDLWLSAAPGPNHWVDVTEQFDRKVEALLAHESQHPQADQVGPMVRQSMAANALGAGFAEGRLAEAFRTHRTG